MVNNSSREQFLVLSVLNGNSNSEWKGGTNYNTIVTLNNDLAANYPNNYIDIRSYLVSLYNPALPQDVIDHNHDVVPTSLRAIDGAGIVTQAFDASATTFTVASTKNSVAGAQVLDIGSGYIYVNDVTAPNTVTSCIRGYAGSVAAPHYVGDAFTSTDPIHLNGAGYTAVAHAVYSWLQTSF